MKNYQDLELILVDTSIDLPQLLIDACQPPWSLDEEGTKGTVSLTGRQPHIFQSNGDSESPPARLVLARRSEDTHYIPNLFPAKPGRFSFDEYNAVLSSFISRVIEAIPEHDKLVSILSSDTVDLSTLLGEEGMNMLKSFSNSANRNALHPNDREKFYDFICLIHSEKIDLDEVMFKRWLVEEDKWTDEQASEVQSDYSTCLELLARYDSKHL